MSSEQPSLLELRELAMAYPQPGDGALHVFSGVSLAVGLGEMVVVVGRSGSGKTTLLKIAAGLLEPSGGRVEWSGRSIAELGPAERTRLRAVHLGFVFQGAALIETLTAAENVAVPRLPNGTSRSARARALLLLDQVGFGARSRHFPAELSGGEQQRVAIARAMFADPPLLLVDEPTANLDRRGAESVTSLLVRLAKEGRGLLVASHDPHLSTAASRVFHLEPPNTD